MIRKYTFFLPTYKTRFLKGTIESILNQTYQDFLLIISDDCSPEPVLSIIEPFLTDERVIYRRNTLNFGAERLTDHFNLLLSRYSSEYVIFPGDDDVYEAHFLEKIDQLALRYPEIDCIRCRTQRIESTGNCLQTDMVIPQIQTQQAFLDSFFCPGIIHCLGNNVFKWSSFIKVGGFPSFPLAWFSDDAAVIQLSEKGVATTTDIHFSFRSSEISISGSDDHIREKISATQLFYQWVKNHPVFQRDMAFRHIVKDYCYNSMMWSDLTKLGFLDIIRFMGSFKSIRIGLSWLKRTYLKRISVWDGGNKSNF